MRVYITNINGHAPQSTAQQAQNMVTDVALSLGYRELGIYTYDITTDSSIELSKRLDGIIAGLRRGDVVIFQSPTWNTTEFDERLMTKLKAYEIKVVIFIHDVVPLMFSGNFYLMKRTIDYYNQANLIIAPSQEMLEILYQHGLTVSKTLIQGMWDHPTNMSFNQPKLKRRIHFPGNPERFSFVTTWDYMVPLHLYSGKNVILPKNVIKEPWQTPEELLLSLSSGGFGLIWTDDHDKAYQELYCPHKLGAFLTAGIPVIVQKGIANQVLIEDNDLGWVVDSLDEIAQLVETISEQEYYDKVTAVSQFNPLLKNGYFTKKVLTDAVFEVFKK